MLKRYFLLLILALQAIAATSQMVYTDPAIPVNSKSLKIYLNTSLITSDASFKNYTGDIYAHTGVTLNGVDWKNVIGSWGVNSGQPKLKYNGNYIYELDITPDIRTFYGLAATDTATKVCIVFRSADATKQTRPDIFIDVYKLVLKTSFSLPEKNSLIVGLNAKIPVKAAATLADSVSLYINNKWIKHGRTADLVTDTITASQYGEYWVKSVAWSLPAHSADSFFVYVRKPVVTEALPSGVKDGINYTGSTSATLVLHAPYKNYVFATGDFNNWTACEKGYMKRTPDGERYWLELTDLTPGKEYRFQYIVDSALYIADPYADKVLDPWNDSYITSETYPGLISYPTNLTTGIVSVLQTNQTSYEWKTTGYTAPDKKKLNVYELLVRDFIAKHDFKTLTDTLSYFSRLGINAIELMPVSEFEGNLSWGYNPSFYFAPDKYYGPKNTMKAFVDSCHARGIAVIMDMVLNHSMGQSPLVQLYLDYYGTDQIFMKTPNPWFNASSPNTQYKWGADFNHESPSTQELVDRITSYWLTEYNVDGFRFDFSKGFTNTPGDGGAYDASRIAILKRMADHIWSVKPQAYVILEHFTADTEEKELAAYGMMTWSNNNYVYTEAAMGYTSDLTSASYLGRGWTIPGIVSYMESHDEERVMFKTVSYGDMTLDYNTRVLKQALNRMKLASLFLFSLPGPKMIWQFGELGYDINIDFNGRTGEKPIKWDYYSDADRHGLFLFYKLLLGFRNNLPVFSTTNYSYSLNSTAKRITLIGSDVSINIIGNFGITQTTVGPSFPQTGKWYEYFSGDSINVTNVSANMTLAPGEYRLYSTKKLGSARLTLGVNDNLDGDPENIFTAWPNPSNGEFNFEFRNGFSPKSTITIYDISGRVIRQISSGSGTEPLKWDGRTTSGTEAGKGLYLVRVKSGYVDKTIKILKN